MFNTILVQPIFNLLALIYAYVHDFGLAIVLLTVLVRLILWPLVSRQLHSQRALQDLQPELKKIKEQAKGDRTLEGQLTMELYKEREINPFASLLPLLVQLPIFFALFVVLKDIVHVDVIAKLVYEPVKHLPAISAIINHKVSFHPTLLGLVDLVKPSIILAATAGAAQFIQTKQISPNVQPDDQQAKIMSSMTYMFPAVTFFIGLSLPGALSLYWTASSLMAVLQQYLVLKRDVRELEEGSPEPTTTPVEVLAPTSQGASPRAGKPKKGKGKRKGS
ncbi:MAG TPA: YidC/Oxa1 family membrane protein insertase [Candidatus Saccharimonadia bacterium]|jgi:YidC/Oxa1 family membrane protein insertase